MKAPKGCLIAEMTDKQFLRWRKWYEIKEREEQKPHRGFYPNGFIKYIKFNVKTKKMYERKSIIGDSDVSGSLPFD